MRRIETGDSVAFGFKKRQFGKVLVFDGAAGLQHHGSAENQ